MIDRKAFEQRIIENPADEAPRLIYADYLEEQDNEELALAMRRTTAEGQKTWGLMTWREWDRLCLDLIPEALPRINLDWAGVLTVSRIAPVVRVGIEVWNYAIDYGLRCSDDLKTLIAHTPASANFIMHRTVHRGDRAEFTGVDKTPDDLLSTVALRWAMRKKVYPDLVAVAPADWNSLSREFNPFRPQVLLDYLQNITIPSLGIPAHVFSPPSTQAGENTE